MPRKTAATSPSAAKAAPGAAPEAALEAAPEAAPDAASDAAPEPARFEDALDELESIVRTLESGEQSLEESLSGFERGVSLARYCRRSLAEAERQVKVLLEEDGTERLVDFESSGGADGGEPAGGDRS